MKIIKFIEEFLIKPYVKPISVVVTEPQTTVKTSKESLKKSNVAVIGESVPLEESESGKQSKSMRYFKMKVLENQKAEVVALASPDARLRSLIIVFPNFSHGLGNI